MLDLSSAYAYRDEPDTTVVDADDLDEDVMQVRVMGMWHRRLLHLNKTACGVPYDAMRTNWRQGALTQTDGGLCGECFHVEELSEAARLDAAREARERIEDEERETKRRELFASLRKKRTKGER